jgi:hypothetical protein
MRAICYCLIFPVTPRRNNSEKRNKNNIVAAAAAAATTTTLDTSKIAFLVLYSVAVAVGIEFRHCEMGVNLSRRQRERGTEKLLKWTFSYFSCLFSRKRIWMYYCLQVLIVIISMLLSVSHMKWLECHPNQNNNKRKKERGKMSSPLLPDINAGPPSRPPMCAGEKEKEVTNDGREGFYSLYLFIFFFFLSP